MKYKYNPPYLIKKIFNSLQWESKSDKILFTFDDGPVPETTPLILQCLALHKIKAIFFCVGENIFKYPGLYEEIIKGGHTIGNHTFNHKAISSLHKNELIEQFEKFNNLIKRKSGDPVQYFRPPYGKFNLSALSLLNKMKLKTVMWSLLTYDYRNDFDVVKFAVNKYLKRNSIIVLHDSIKSKDIIIDSINYTLDELYRRGYRTGEPAECLR